MKVVVNYDNNTDTFNISFKTNSTITKHKQKQLKTFGEDSFEINVSKSICNGILSINPINRHAIKASDDKFLKWSNGVNELLLNLVDRISNRFKDKDIDQVTTTAKLIINNLVKWLYGNYGEKSRFWGPIIQSVSNFSEHFDNMYKDAKREMPGFESPIINLKKTNKEIICPLCKNDRIIKLWKRDDGQNKVYCDIKCKCSDPDYFYNYQKMISEGYREMLYEDDVDLNKKRDIIRGLGIKTFGEGYYLK